MTAALAVAEHGYEVDLVETGEELGGNLLWLGATIEGHDLRPLLDESRQKIERHPLIHVHRRTQMIGTFGQVGRYVTTVENSEGQAATLAHGVTILATGGREAATELYHHGDSPAVVTQKEFERQLSDQAIDARQLESVVMIQCVGSREEPRNYCSRVCCTAALKHALNLKKQHPGIAVYVLYRDMMTYGFSEAYYTRARAADVVFIQYEPAAKPEVVLEGQADTGGKPLAVKTFDPILNQEVQIDADLVVLATGIVPQLPADLVRGFGADLDRDGFFQEAESKWRPVDSITEGVFACGLSLAPHSVPEAVATAEAAAQRALRILNHEQLPSGKVVASVRHSLCSLCERCIDACPYGARSIDPELEQVTVNPVMCQGCGACAAVCPNSASILEGFTPQQMFDIIDAAMV